MIGSTWSFVRDAVPLAGTVLFSITLLAACGQAGEEDAGGGASSIDSTQFTHHYISQDLPGDIGWGYGVVPPADFDGDGDIDYGIYARNDSVYWFENRGIDNWVRHSAGALPTRNLGGAVIDVDGDGYTDILQGGLWFHNPGNPTASTFDRYVYDDRINAEIHDLTTADINGDGQEDLVALGDADGVFWYSIPDNPAQDTNWPRTTITMSVLDENDDIHSGFFPQGIGDLDGDGDADVVLADRWLENQDGGTEWVRHLLPYGARGPWGLSSRSWIVDLNGDGNPDIVSLESDGTGSGGAWLENNGDETPSFIVHELPTTHRGTRGSFHSLFVGDFDNDGDPDIFTAEQEDSSILPMGEIGRAVV